MSFLFFQRENDEILTLWRGKSYVIPVSPFAAKGMLPDCVLDVNTEGNHTCPIITPRTTHAQSKECDEIIRKTLLLYGVNICIYTYIHVYIPNHPPIHTHRYIYMRFCILHFLLSFGVNLTTKPWFCLSSFELKYSSTSL